MDKFKDQEALQKAYESLEKEFARRSRQLRELQRKIGQRMSNEQTVEEFKEQRNLSIENIEKELTNYLFMSCSYGALVCGKMSISIAEEQAKRFAPFLYGFIQQAVKDTAEKFANSIEDILKQPFEGKTEKQEWQRKGMEEGLRMALEICKEIKEGKV